MVRGVIVEFDFAVLNGADILFSIARNYLDRLDGIELDAQREARYLVGKSYLAGLTDLFASIKTKKTAAKSARELEEEFNEAVTRHAAQAVTPAFANFVKVLADHGVRVVLATRARPADVAEELAPILGDNVLLRRVRSRDYGSTSCAAWRAACEHDGLTCVTSCAVTGSGSGVKTAMRAGMATVAVINEHVSYQDFTGADTVVNALSTQTARKIMKILKV